jgi:hypothetical protein
MGLEFSELGLEFSNPRVEFLKVVVEFSKVGVEFLKVKLVYPLPAPPAISIEKTSVLLTTSWKAWSRTVRNRESL